jgi:hypothetical protein
MERKLTLYKLCFAEMDDQENESEALMHILTDATAEPIMLSYRFLENITDNFSKDLEIGTGGFGVVYMVSLFLNIISIFLNIRYFILWNQMPMQCK